MPRLTLTLLFCVSACLGQAKRPQAPAQQRRMRLEAFGFSVEPPRGWNAAVDGKGLPIFANFQWSKLGAQFALPRGGALINVVDWDKLPRRRGDETLLGWASLDAGIAVPPSVVSRTLDVPVPTGISEAVLSTFDVATFSPQDQPQREISVYWAFQLKKFSAHMAYIVGDPRAAEYEPVLKAIVFSIRPL